MTRILSHKITASKLTPSAWTLGNNSVAANMELLSHEAEFGKFISWNSRHNETNYLSLKHTTTEKFIYFYPQEKVTRILTWPVTFINTYNTLICMALRNINTVT